MKNKSTVIILGVAILFIGLMVGIFIGTSNSRNYIELTYDPDTYTDETGTVDITPEVVKIDINTATVEDLMIIPGIGEVTANNIIEYRTKHGKFAKIDELLDVKGIGPKSLEKISEYITVKR